MLRIDSTVSLHGGGRMPCIGFGTYCQPPRERVTRAVQHAVDAGYRLVDTAMSYQNEHFVGAALARSGIPRDQLFITTKIWKDAMRLHVVRESLEESLESLGLEYIDLLLIHRPLSALNVETWHVMEDLVAEGLAKSIGVSNFTIKHIEALKETSTHVPDVNQVEFHPFFFRKELLQYCTEHGIILEAYSPLALGTKLEDARLLRIAEGHGKQASQVLIRWSLQHGCVPIPRSLSEEHIKENINVFDFSLTSDEMEIMDGWNEDFMVISPDPDEPAIR